MESIDLISIIIPSYNHERYIERCVGSVLRQTYKDIELIIIDDGSTDRSIEIIESFKDSRIKLYKQDNKGAHNAINKGLSVARGEFLSILNSDDEYYDSRLEGVMRVFSENKSIDFISTWIEIVDENSNRLGVKKAWENLDPWTNKEKSKTYYSKNNYILNALMTNFVSTTSNMVFRRSVYKKVGGMRRLRFAHDWDFLLRVCASHECFSFEDVLLKYRVHGDNTISKERKWMLFEICWVIAANIQRFSSLIINGLDKNSLIESLGLMANSFNFQGNEKVFWLLLIHIELLKGRGVENPEELFIEDEELRNYIIEMIVV